MSTYDFDGHDVTDHRIRVTKAGDGLSEAIHAEDQKSAMQGGDEVTLILKGNVSAARFEPVDRKDLEGDWRRVNTIEVTTAKIIDPDLVADVMIAHENMIYEYRQREKERKQGVKRLPLDTDAEQADEDGMTDDPSE